MLTAEPPMSTLASDLAKCKVTGCTKDDVMTRSYSGRLIGRPISKPVDNRDTSCGMNGYGKHEGRKSGIGRCRGVPSSTGVDEFVETRQLRDHYYLMMDEVLGSGGFGSVYAGMCKMTGRGVAIKDVSRKNVCGWSMLSNRVVPKEVALHLSLDQKYIIKLLDFFEEQDRFYIVMEKPEKYIDLFDYISEKGRVSERSSRYLFRQILLAVQYCLSQGVVHRDVKDENILIDLNSHQIKLIDFGSGTFLQDDVYTEYEGTIAYSPPEWVLHHRYHAVPATIWSLGILLYDMLLGDVPFEEKKEIAAARLHFHVDISEDAEHLIRWMLSFSPEDRPTLEQVLNHPWMQAQSPSSSKSSSNCSTSSTSSSPAMSSPSSDSASPSSTHSSFSSASSYSMSSSSSLQSSSSVTSSPNLRYNFRSSTLAGGSGHKPKASPTLSRSTYLKNSISQSSVPQSSALSATTTTRSGHQHMLRSDTRLKCHSPHLNGSVATPTCSARNASHSPMSTWKMVPTGEHDRNLATAGRSLAKSRK